MARIDGRARKIGASVFPEMDVRRLSAGRAGRIELPADWTYVRVHRVVDEHSLAEREAQRLDTAQIDGIVGRGGIAGEAILDVDIAVHRRVVAHHRVVPGVQRLELRLLEERRAGAPGEVDVPFEVAVGDEPRHLQPQRVLEAQETDAV